MLAETMLVCAKDPAQTRGRGDEAMRMRLIAVALLFCAGLAHAEDAQTPQPPESSTPAPPRIQSTEPKQSLERAPADSQIEKSSEPVARYSLRRVDGGFLRFDAQTGQVAYCNSQHGGWSCEAVPETRAALEKQVEQLRAEVDALQQKLKAQDEPPRPPRPIPPPAASPPKPGNGDMTFAIPGREHITRAVAAVQDAWQRFVDLVIGFKNDVLRGDG
jgi:hypothetical protein